ncbi:MAG TPA: hypothetical protein VFN49_13125 [Candidatus Aquilonibacter sp.]|nr:hypothetical protein [Candidatus Aquilonibacter sp.]
MSSRNRLAAAAALLCIGAIGCAPHSLSSATIAFGPGSPGYNDGCGYEAYAIDASNGNVPRYGIYHLVRGLDLPLGTALRGDLGGTGEREITDVSHGRTLTINVVWHGTRLSDVRGTMSEAKYGCNGPRRWNV